MCCDENAHGRGSKTCFDEMNPDYKYNVSSLHRQEEEPIEIKEMTPLIHNGGAAVSASASAAAVSSDVVAASDVVENNDAFDALNASSTVPLETPLHPKENDELAAQDIGCYTITLMLRANSFNRTLSSREICGTAESLIIQSFTIPLSPYMRDSQLEILFT